MGLFGALFAGVSGLDSQSNKIGIISNNIANVNTVGFKQGQASFDTLVVPSGTTTFSPGGVIGNTQQLVNQQGLVQASSSPTDIAITGNGFFAVNTAADGSGSLLLTRAGSFTQDANGNFVNADGNFLQGIPITTPPTSINTNNLKTVTVNQNATGAATATSTLGFTGNFTATQAVLLGNGITGTMATNNGTSSVNASINGSSIIVGNDLVPGLTSNNLVRGNQFTITSNGTTADMFTYGGFAIGRNVTDTVNGVATTGDGDGANILDTENIAANSITTNIGAGTANQITISNVTNGNDFVAGDYATISNVASAPTGSGLTAAEIDGTWKVISKTGTSVTLQIGTNATAAVANGGGTLTLTNRTADFTGNILNATSATADFLNSGTAPLTAADFSAQAVNFTIAVGSGTPVTFTYNAAPDPSKGSFNSLNTLAEAINDATGMSARVVSGRLYVSATDANQQVTFTNGDAAGNGTLPGINWVQELDLPTSIAAAPSTAHRFNSLSGLATEINSVDPTDLLATVNNPTTSATISINEANPEQTIDFTDNQALTAGSILKELGVQNLSLNGAGEETSGTKGVVYNPTSSATDMSSGAVQPQFSHDITIFDAQGISHTLALNVVKTGVNQWGVELTAVPASDISQTAAGLSPTDGQVAWGTLTFNGNGQLSQLVGTIASPFPITWTNGAAQSTVTVNLGLTSGAGISQSAANFNASYSQNGSPIGQLTGVTIDQNGFVIEAFSNGQTQKVFQIPLASVSNPDGLEGVSGDAYQQTLASGQIQLSAAGQDGTGAITPSALEQSNVDLSTQLTNLIVAQQAYGANSKVLTVADTLLQELDQIIQ